MAAGAWYTQNKIQKDKETKAKQAAEAKNAFKEQNGWNEIHYACNGGWQSEVKAAIKANPREINAKDKIGRTPLLLAIQKGWDKVVEILLKNRADASQSDSSTRTCTRKNYLSVNQFLRIISSVRLLFWV
ncbi:MAG: ankyrin repeat domain-containing protein [Candidatus Berkiella sp.]